MRAVQPGIIAHKGIFLRQLTQGTRHHTTPQASQNENPPSQYNAKLKTCPRDIAQQNRMPSQRPYFLSSFIAAFRQQPPPSNHSQASSTGKQHTPASQQQSQPQHTSSTSTSSPAQTSTIAAAAVAAAAAANHHHHRHGVTLHSPRASPANVGTSPAAATVGIPIPSGGGRRRGSDSSSEGFRDVLGADKWYIGGRTATGEEKFFKLGVVRRVRSNDGLSLDRLSL